MNRLRSVYRALSALALLGTPMGLAGCQDASVDPPLELRNVGNAGEVGEAGPWSAWRGGQQQAQCRVSSPAMMSVELQPIWRTPIPGSGNSSPVFIDNTILLTMEIDVPNDDSSAAPDLAILAFDAGTGEIRWRSLLGKGRGPTHGKAGHASATIAAAGDRGFAFFGEAGLFCFSLADGSTLWHHEFTGNRHEWGLVSSPVLYGELVIQLVDGEQGGSFLAAYEQSTGRLVWRTERESYGCWTTPIVVDRFDRGAHPQTTRARPVSSGRDSGVDDSSPPRDGRAATSAQLIVNGTGHKDGTPGWVISYDPLHGEELWRARGTSDIPVPTALVWKDHVISASGGNGPVFSVRADGFGDVTSSHVPWRLPTGGPYVPSGLVLEDRLYLLMDHGAMVCRDAYSGELLGRQRLAGTFTASLVGAGGFLYAVSEAGDVSVIRDSEDVDLVRTFSLHEPCLATPAIVDGRLFLRTAQHLYCLGPAELGDQASLTDQAMLIDQGASLPSVLSAMPTTSLHAVETNDNLRPDSPRDSDEFP